MVLDTKGKFRFQNIFLGVAQFSQSSPEQQLKNNILFFSTSYFYVSLFICLQQIYFSTCPRKKHSLFNVKKTNHCPCIFGGAQKDVLTCIIDLQVIYDGTVITAVRKKTYVWCTINVKRKYASYGHRMLRGATHLLTKLYVTSRLARQTSICLPLHSQSLQYDLFTLRIATGATTGKTRNTRTVNKHVRPIVTEALVRSCRYGHL